MAERVSGQRFSLQAPIHVGEITVPGTQGKNKKPTFQACRPTCWVGTCMLTLFKMVQCYIPSTILCGITSREQIEPTSNFTMIHGKQSIAITCRSTTLLNSFNTFLKHIAISSFLQYLLPVHMQADAGHIASTSKLHDC